MTDRLQSAGALETAPMFGSLTLTEVLTIVWVRRRLLAMVAAIPLVLAILALLVLHDRYRAEASILVKTGREFLTHDEGNANGQSGPQATKQETVNSEIEILGARSVVEDAIVRSGGVKAIFPSIAASADSPAIAMDEAVLKFNKRLLITGVKLSNVIDLSLDLRTPEQATMVLANLIAAYRARHAAVFGAGNSSAAYEQAMTDDMNERDRLEQQRQQIKVGNGIFDISQQRSALIQTRGDATERLRQATERHNTLVQRLAFLEGAGGKLSKDVLSTESDKQDNVVAAGVTTLMNLRATESQLLARYSPDNPAVQQIEAQIVAAQSQAGALPTSFTHVTRQPSPLAQTVDQEVVMDHAELAPLDTTMRVDAAQVAGLSSELSRLEKADTALRGVEARIDAIDDNMKTAREGLGKAEAEEVMDRAESESLSIVEQPVAALKPVFPNIILFVAAAIVLGGLASSGLVVFWLIFPTQLVAAGTIERLLRLPVVATFSSLAPPTARKEFAIATGD